MQNKEALVNRTAERTGLSKKDTKETIDATLDVIEEILANGETLNLINFGKFEVRQRAARKGRNPQTGEEIQIPETKVPGFKPGKRLKNAVK